MRGLEQAEDIIKRNWPKSKKWKVFLIVSGIIFLLIGLAALTVWFLTRVVKSLTVGGYRNRDLYIPRMRRYR